MRNWDWASEINASMPDVTPPRLPDSGSEAEINFQHLFSVVVHLGHVAITYAGRQINSRRHRSRRTQAGFEAEINLHLQSLEAHLSYTTVFLTLFVESTPCLCES